MEIYRAQSEAEIAACYAVVQELRPHLSLADFMDRVGRQREMYGYKLVYAMAADKVAAVAGYRVVESLSWGRAFYVDDLITAGAFRRQGYGGTLCDWLLREAKTLLCQQFHLDSGVQRHDAHRLYFGKKLMIMAHHFSCTL